MPPKTPPLSNPKRKSTSSPPRQRTSTEPAASSRRSGFIASQESGTSNNASRGPSPNRISPLGVRRASSPTFATVDRGLGIVTPPDRRSPVQSSVATQPASGAHPPPPVPRLQSCGGRTSPLVDEEANGRAAIDRDCEMQRLEVMLLEKKAELLRVEHALKHYSNLMSIVERRGRAEDLRIRAAPVREASASMKLEIATLRNADRVTVALREQREAVEKHLRLRRAQIRQKEATIDVITKRCLEQREGSQQLLCGIEVELARMDELCKEKDALGCGLADRVQPMRAVRSLLTIDESRCDALEVALLQTCRLQHENVDVDRLLKTASAAADAAQRLLADDDAIQRCARDAEVQQIIEQHRQNWEAEKTILLQHKADVQRLIRDNEFHIRRGTNVKSMSQYPCPSNASFLIKSVRDVKLTLVDIEALVAADRVTLDEHQRKHETLRALHDEELAKRTAITHSLAEKRQSLETEERKLREYEAILAERCAQSTAAPSVPVTRSRNNDAATRPTCESTANRYLYTADPTLPSGTLHTGEGDECRAAAVSCLSPAAQSRIRRQRDKANKAVLSKRPSSLLERLTQPTASFQRWSDSMRAESFDRAQRLGAVAAHRPEGCS